MPKRKSQKTNNSPSQEEAASTKPAILRIVKQNNTATEDNTPALSESVSTTLPKENHSVDPELQVNDNQIVSIEVSQSNSSPVLTSDAIPRTITVDNEQPGSPQTLETASSNLSESTVNIESISDEDRESEIDLDQAKSAKKPGYKKLETATNSKGQTFTLQEKIEVSTGNFGIQKVFIISLYEAADGSIWAYYHPVDKTQRQLWKRGCCRIEYLNKLDSNSPQA
ncbi:hypothetical protein HCG51_35235 (plasmid) [Tolypothrix sp. PCC 7910]|uniref:hypothetical protein n=1 Tax=Tolypothrix sp. PCC 7910 TaxID=2099387 RepID=UPI001427887B|nr:hypothetical protein [Tolypothrix sp. PCC 7910]QIR41932.1 hypothetical protein HCG51_35235 [Tolypothrix sp. PCC 7910]